MYKILTLEQLLKEIKLLEERNSELFEHMKCENKANVRYIANRCVKCINYDVVIYKNFIYDCCNDNWSGKYAPGWHTIYGETLDICCDSGGFKEKV